MTPRHLVGAGLGSVGARLIESVVRTTLDPHRRLVLGRLTLLDRELLEADNLMRHEGLPDEVGLRKTELVARRVTRLAPAIAVDQLHGSIFEDETAARLDAALETADLVVASFDDSRALQHLGVRCAERGVPLLVVEVIAGGIGLWLLAAAATSDAPCLACLAVARAEDPVQDSPPQPVLDYADPRSLVPRTRVPADDWTCAVAAALCAGEAVRALRDGGLRTPPLRLVALERVDTPEVAPFFQAPLQVTEILAPRRPDCAVCSTHPVDAADHVRHLAFFGAPASS